MTVCWNERRGLGGGGHTMGGGGPATRHHIYDPGSRFRIASQDARSV